MNKQALIWVIIVIALLGVGAFWLLQDGTDTVPQADNVNQSFNEPNNVTPTLNDSLPTFTNINGEYQGTLEITGYVEMRQLSGFSDESREYAFFRIIDANTDLIYDYLRQSQGNSFISENSIGLGCNEPDRSRIFSTNNSATGTIENIITGDELQRLLASSANNPVTIQATKPSPPSGSGAPVCYSHFRDFKLLPQ